MLSIAVLTNELCTAWCDAFLVLVTLMEEVKSDSNTETWKRLYTTKEL